MTTGTVIYCHVFLQESQGCVRNKREKHVAEMYRDSISFFMKKEIDTKLRSKRHF